MCDYMNCKDETCISVCGKELCEKHWLMYCEVTDGSYRIDCFCRGEYSNDLNRYIRGDNNG